MNHSFVALDATGSMAGKSQEVADAANEYVGSLPEDTNLSIFMFDSERWLTYHEGKAENYPAMKASDHVPGAYTPLYDICAKLIAYAETKVQPGDRVMIMVDTDGKENYSKEHTQESIRELVKTRQEEGWAFLFMSQGLDRNQAEQNAAPGRAMGMAAMKATTQNRGSNYRSAALQTNAFYQSGKMPVHMDSDAEADRSKSQDPKPEPRPFRPATPAPATVPAQNASQAEQPTQDHPSRAKPWSPASRATAASRT